ncbi:MAG: DoxX family protein [Candidatus Pseudobacter hemicellulosilyticus]|uniref:DoxX family protein n=1 Tax=Candidatus Pseudobacter hemicellulosilyticus TaxID=3121375 RepID=A0AAJ6BEJ8_9BACT|nr:MAG: DoxX family protein [Pseudobacter sp.]
MKKALTIIRIFVGVLFIFSGLVKANDPLGLSYKMQEFFEIWGWHFLNDYTLALSIAMNAFEIIAGVAVLVGWQMRLFSWLLSLLIVFFTFLTGYALFSGKVRECGCFGDCIPLTSDQSFMKDLLLLVLIGIIFYYRNTIKPATGKVGSIVILFFTTVLSLALQFYVLEYLPLVDCLPYKKGNNIPGKMKAPPGAIPDSTVITFVYTKQGKEIEFTADAFPDDFDEETYSFVKRYDKVVRKGNAEVKIKDFILKTVAGNDTTQALLAEDRYQLYLFLKNDYNQSQWMEYLKLVMHTAGQKQIPGFIVTSIPFETLTSNPPDVFRLFTPLACDAVAIKTAARANPTLFLIKNGTVIDKWSYADLERAVGAVQKLP